MSHGRKNYKTRPPSDIIIYKITTLYKTLYLCVIILMVIYPLCP